MIVKNMILMVAVIFEKDDLPETPYLARKRIQEAMIEAGGNFSKEPECRTNAVTIWYKDGYHIDFAIHRQYFDNFYDEIIEHAGTEWTKRNPSDITNWFDERVNSKSPKKENGAEVDNGQLRRIVQLI